MKYSKQNRRIRNKDSKNWRILNVHCTATTFTCPIKVTYSWLRTTYKWNGQIIKEKMTS